MEAAHEGQDDAHLARGEAPAVGALAQVGRQQVLAVAVQVGIDDGLRDPAFVAPQ